MVSIIIPCYNNGNYLVKMIDSFRRQTSDDWELIVVDDGSTDDTPQVVEDAFSDLPNAYFYRRDRQPKGSVVCRNIGFEHAQGKYVCHLDADDLVSPTFVEHRVAFMEEHPEIDYASFPAKKFSDINHLPDFDDDGDIWGTGNDSDDLLLRMMKGYGYPFSVWCNIYKKESIESLPWDEKVRIYTDFSFIVPCILAGLKHRFSDLREIDYYYRDDLQNKVAMTSNFASKAKCESTIYLFSKTLDSFLEHKLASKYKKAFFDFITLHLSRIVMSQDANYKDNVNTYINMCDKYYHCKTRFKMFSQLNKINNRTNRYRALSVAYALLFGDTHFLKPYWDSFKRKFA